MAIYEMQRGIPGLLFGNFYDSDSGILQDAPEKNPEGGQAIFRIKGKEGEVSTKSGANAIFAGVQIRNDLGLKKKAGDAIAFIKQGSVWVEAGEEVQVGDKAYYNATTNQFVKTANNNVDVKGFFKTNAIEGQEVVLELTGNV